jgi:hypothetical protein
LSTISEMKTPANTRSRYWSISDSSEPLSIRGVSTARHTDEMRIANITSWSKHEAVTIAWHTRRTQLWWLKSRSE